MHEDELFQCMDSVAHYLHRNFLQKTRDGTFGLTRVTIIKKADFHRVFYKFLDYIFHWNFLMVDLQFSAIVDLPEQDSLAPDLGLHNQGVGDVQILQSFQYS